MRFVKSAAFAAALAVPAVGLSNAAFADAYTLDKSHAAVLFSVSHFGFSDTRAQFREFDAQIDYYPEDPAKSSVSFTIDTASIDSNWAKRDEHIRSADFLNVAEYPTITFVSKSIEMTGENTAKMTGDVTMLGQTHEETFDVTLAKQEPNMRGVPTAGFLVTGEIDRTKYGMGTYAPAIGAVIPLTIDLEINKAQ